MSFNKKKTWGIWWSITYSGARNISSTAFWEDGPAVSSTLPRKLRTPASATLAMKFSSTRTFDVLKSLCTNRGLRVWRWDKPANWKKVQIRLHKYRSIKFETLRRIKFVWVSPVVSVQQLSKRFCGAETDTRFLLFKENINKYQESQKCSLILQRITFSCP